VGCLQDVHWSHGSFGYFPTYTLGNLYSTQFYNQAKKDIAGLEEKLAKGDLKVLAKWLKEQIHWVGKSERPETIVKRVCNEPLNSQYFIDYLNTKYTTLYSL
jgi:carboxypeptidase Taq